MSEIGQIISTIGFPIAMCLIMGYYLKYTHDDHREDIKRLQDQQKDQDIRNKETMEKLVEAINNNTKTMERIFDLQEYHIEDNENE